MVKYIIPYKEETEYYLDMFLTEEQRKFGFHIREDFGTGVTLLCPDKQEIHFTEYTRAEIVRAEADRIMGVRHGG